MQTPFYLRLRSLNLLEAALRTADTKVLASMIKNIPGKDSLVFDPCTQKLVQAELIRRRLVNSAV